MSDKTKKEIEVIVKAREILKKLWDDADLRGRCWGLKKDGENLFKGTNITIGYGDEIISISQKNGKLIIHEFTRTANTKLGKKAKDLLNKDDQ